ncbi:hypothetical protein DSECCO2_494780 [anaerobic digester metagenome]|jgi:hypothetical protein
MKRSNTVEDLKMLPDLDYSNLPKEIEEAINRKPYVIDKKAKLTWDGRQFIIRIPSEIAEEMELTAENRVHFRLTKPLPGSDEEPKLEIELI